MGFVTKFQPLQRAVILGHCYSDQLIFYCDAGAVPSLLLCTEVPSPPIKHWAAHHMYIHKSGSRVVLILVLKARHISVYFCLQCTNSFCLQLGLF